MQSPSNNPGLELSALVTLARVSHATPDAVSEGLHDDLREIVDGLTEGWARNIGEAILTPETEAALSPSEKVDLDLVRKLAGIDSVDPVA